MMGDLPVGIQAGEETYATPEVGGGFIFSEVLLCVGHGLHGIGEAFHKVLDVDRLPWLHLAVQDVRHDLSLLRRDRIVSIQSSLDDSGGGFLHPCLREFGCSRLSCALRVCAPCDCESAADRRYAPNSGILGAWITATELRDGTGLSWGNLNGWILWAGDLALCVSGHTGVFVEASKADFNQILVDLFGPPAGQHPSDRQCRRPATG